jgi:hypothetical protein
MAGEVDLELRLYCRFVTWIVVVLIELVAHALYTSLDKVSCCERVYFQFDEEDKCCIGFY